MAKQEMPKRENDIRIEAHLSPEEYKVFEKIMQDKDWSKKKLAENIIKEYLVNYKKKSK
jgi:hypothetical protein